MNERHIIDTLRAKFPIADGSTPREITPEQQRARNIAGSLLTRAHKKGKRRRWKWVDKKQAN